MAIPAHQLPDSIERARVVKQVLLRELSGGGSGQIPAKDMPDSLHMLEVVRESIDQALCGSDVPHIQGVDCRNL